MMFFLLCLKRPKVTFYAFEHITDSYQTTLITSVNLILLTDYCTKILIKTGFYILFTLLQLS